MSISNDEKAEARESVHQALESKRLPVSMVFSKFEEALSDEQQSYIMDEVLGLKDESINRLFRPEQQSRLVAEAVRDLKDNPASDIAQERLRGIYPPHIAEALIKFYQEEYNPEAYSFTDTSDGAKNVEEGDTNS